MPYEETTVLAYPTMQVTSINVGIVLYSLSKSRNKSEYCATHMLQLTLIS
jgi:hypothetical protein